MAPRGSVTVSLEGQACHTVYLITELDKTTKSHRIKKNYASEVTQQRVSQTSSTIFTVGQLNSMTEKSTTGWQPGK